MADTGWQFASSAISDGQGDFPFNQPTKILAIDADYSQGSATGALQFSDNFKMQNYAGFSSVPASAVIDGIEVNMVQWSWQTSSGMDWVDAQLIEADGISTSDSRAGDLTAITNSDKTEQIGGPSDMWGLTGIEPTDIKDTDWGFQFDVFAIAALDDFRIDAMQMKVYYTVGPQITFVNGGLDEWNDGQDDNTITGTNLV